jgi:hypothetical protein
MAAEPGFYRGGETFPGDVRLSKYLVLRYLNVSMALLPVKRLLNILMQEIKILFRDHG